MPSTNHVAPVVSSTSETATVTGGVVADVGHFLPEESPNEIVREILAMTHPTHDDRSAS